VIDLTDLLRPIGTYLLEQPVGTRQAGRYPAGRALQHTRQEEARHGKGIQGHRIARGSTSAFGFWVNDIRPVHWGESSIPQFVLTGECRAFLTRYFRRRNGPSAHTQPARLKTRQISKPPSDQKGEQNRARDGSDRNPAR